jgi:hypothetical protein
MSVMLLSVVTTAYPREQFNTQSAAMAAAPQVKTMQLRQELSNSQSINEKQPAAADATEQRVQWLTMSDPPPRDTDSWLEDDMCRFCRRQLDDSSLTAGDVPEIILMQEHRVQPA